MDKYYQNYPNHQKRPPYQNHQNYPTTPHRPQYHGAGILPFCTDYPGDENKNKLWVLLLHETRIDNHTNECQKHAYIDLGGKREFHDSNAAFTAVREMNEESNNLYKDQAPEMLDQIRERRYARLVLQGKRPYFLFCVKVPFREVLRDSCLEWVEMSDLLTIKGDQMHGFPVSHRLLDIINGHGTKQRLLQLG